MTTNSVPITEQRGLKHATLPDILTYAITSNTFNAKGSKNMYDLRVKHYVLCSKYFKTNLLQRSHCTAILVMWHTHLYSYPTNTGTYMQQHIHITCSQYSNLCSKITLAECLLFKPMANKVCTMLAVS